MMAYLLFNIAIFAIGYWAGKQVNLHDNEIDDIRFKYREIHSIESDYFENDSYIFDGKENK